MEYTLYKKIQIKFCNCDNGDYTCEKNPKLGLGETHDDQRANKKTFQMGEGRMKTGKKSFSRLLL